MKGIRKLLSLNLALIFLLSSFATAVPARAEEAGAQEPKPDKMIVVNGEIFDITRDPFGTGWKAYYNETEDNVYLILEDYKGGAIYTNISAQISLMGNNIITGDVDYGIGVQGDLRLYSSTDGDGRGSLAVSGADKYSAIRVTGEFSFSAELTATGGNASALHAGTIHYDDYWPAKILVGDSKETAKPEGYSGQIYLDIHRVPYVLTLEGNGGKTPEDATSKTIYRTTGTMGMLFLYPHKDTFVNEGKRLLGWTDVVDDIDTLHPLNEEYAFPSEAMTASLFALWEGEEHKAVLLKDYCGLDDYNVWDRIVACETGAEYELPQSTKPGCAFRSWLGEDGKTYPAGTKITVTDSISFQAQYETLILTIDGRTYDASQDQGSYAVGWHYNASLGSRSQLDIYENYSGEYISVPCNVHINLHSSLTGTEGKPAINGAGDIRLAVYPFNSNVDTVIQLTGGAGSSAVVADGDIRIDVSNNTTDTVNRQLLAKGGESGIPALSAGGRVRVDEKVYYAGADADNLKLVGKYLNEPYLAIKDAREYSIQLNGTKTVPNVPENDDYAFAIWADDRKGKLVWYRPDDTIEAGTGKTLEAVYVNRDRSMVMIIIDGNGGRAANQSKYYVVYNDFAPYKLPTSAFTYSGYTLRGFNTKRDGSGQSYAEGATLPNDGKTLIYDLYAQWEDNSGGSGGGGGGGGAAPVDSVADAIKQASKNGSITLEPPSKGEGVTLTEEHIKQILEKSLSVEAKTETGSLKLSTETLARLAKENDGKELKFTLGKADDTDKISVGGLFLNLSVSALGKEIHDVSGSAKIHLDGVGKGDVVTLVHYNADGTVKDVSFITVKESGLVEFPFDSLSYYSLLKRNETSAYLVFGDVGEKTWFGKAVSYAYQNKLFDGTSATSFSPDMKMNREMFATVLYRLAGSPAFSGETTFSDVADSSSYYYSAILWCAQNRIINGYPDGRFGVGDLVTREQMVSMLYRYAKDYAKEDVTAEADDPLQTYTDAVDISKGAYEAFRWAVGTGVLRGATSTEMLPQATATRAEVAQILMNYAKLK